MVKVGHTACGQMVYLGVLDIPVSAVDMNCYCQYFSMCRAPYFFFLVFFGGGLVERAAKSAIGN